MYRLCIIVSAVLALLPWCSFAGESDQNVSEDYLCNGAKTAIKTIVPAPESYQHWIYTTSANEYLTCIGYYAVGNTRFLAAPVFVSSQMLYGDRLGWSTYISADKKTIYVFGPRSHFGPFSNEPYTIAYKTYYDTMQVAQDTVVWDGNTSKKSWAREGTPGNGGIGTWAYSPDLFAGPYLPLESTWLSLGLSGSLNCSVVEPYAGRTEQMGPAAFGDQPGEWGGLNYYAAHFTMPQISADVYPDNGVAMAGTTKIVSPDGLTSVATGQWWLYNINTLNNPKEQGNWQLLTKRQSETELAKVTGIFTFQDGSTVEYPDWQDWASIGNAKFVGTLSTSNTLEGRITASDNKLILQSSSGQPIVYTRSGVQLTMQLHQQHMAAPAAGFQAFLSYDTDMLDWVSGSYPIAPYGNTILPPSSSNGNINLAAGINPAIQQPPYAASAKLADLKFITKYDEGITQVVFRDFTIPSVFADNLGNELITQTVDGPVIVIDNTPPINLALDVDPPSWSNSINYTLTFSAEDTFSGVDHFNLQVGESDFLAVASPYELDTTYFTDGTHPVTIRAYDRSGNMSFITKNFYIDRTKPTIQISSVAQNSVELPNGPNAMIGTVDIFVDAEDAGVAPSGLDGVPVVTITPAGESPQDLTCIGQPNGKFHYQWTVTSNTPNGTAVISASVRDIAGNTEQAQSVNINVNKSRALIDLRLQSVSVESVTRPITFTIGGSGGSVPPVTRIRQVTFTNGAAEVEFDDPDLPATGQWLRISAKDEQHTLQKTVDLVESPVGSRQYTADIILPGGDCTNDNIIDIRDYGVFAGQYNTTGHPYSGQDADFSCDGKVNTGDFSYIQTQFFAKGDAKPGYAMAAAGMNMPMSSITVEELAKIIGAKEAKKADINKDGLVDIADMKLFLEQDNSKTKPVWSGRPGIGNVINPPVVNPNKGKGTTINNGPTLNPGWSGRPEIGLK